MSGAARKVIKHLGDMYEQLHGGDDSDGYVPRSVFVDYCRQVISVALQRTISGKRHVAHACSRVVPLQHAGSKTAATERVRVACATRIVRRDRDVPVHEEASPIVAKFIEDARSYVHPAPPLNFRFPSRLASGRMRWPRWLP